MNSTSIEDRGEKYLLINKYHLEKIIRRSTSSVKEGWVLYSSKVKHINMFSKVKFDLKTDSWTIWSGIFGKIKILRNIYNNIWNILGILYVTIYK